jgi:Serine dehydrogenase proteinase
MAGAATAYKDFQMTVGALEKRRNSRIFCVIHTGDAPHICQPEMRALLRNRDEFTGLRKLEILIHSPGGHADKAYRMARYFRAHCRELNVLIPKIAKSAATILCLNADNIFMGEFAELGPIDAQMRDEVEKGQDFFSPLDEFKAVQFLREYSSDILDYLSFVLEHRGMSVKQALHESMHGVIGIMNPLYSHVDPSKLGSYRQVLAEGEEYAKRLLKLTMDEDEAAELARHLVWDYPAHDFVIDREEAKQLGLPVQKLPASEERALISAISRLEDYEIPFVGFISDDTTTKKRRTKRAKRTGARKVPTAVKSPPRPAIAS